MGNIEHPERISLTPCPECGRPELRDEDRDQFCDGTDCRMTGREQVPYVPASELQGAVEALEKIAGRDTLATQTLAGCRRVAREALASLDRPGGR